MSNAENPAAVAPRVLILATSLNPRSRSRVLAHFAHGVLGERGIEAELVDIRDLGDLPFAGAPNAYGPHLGLDSLKAKLAAATHVVFAVPIYNFAVNAVSKNVVELMGADQLGGKTVGFLCAAGGPRGYMGVLPLANSLMLDFRCWIVPRFVYATREEVVDGQIASDDVKERIRQLATEMLERVPPMPAA